MSFKKFLQEAVVIKTSEPKTTLTWEDLFKIMKRDNGGRWYAEDDVAIEYIDLNNYRAPSRAFPHSHSKPLLTKKYAKWLVQNHKRDAELFGLSTDLNDYKVKRGTRSLDEDINVFVDTLANATVKYSSKKFAVVLDDDRTVHITFDKDEDGVYQPSIDSTIENDLSDEEAEEFIEWLLSSEEVLSKADEFLD